MLSPITQSEKYIVQHKQISDDEVLKDFEQGDCAERTSSG
jgi:hypothetical protein